MQNEVMVGQTVDGLPLQPRLTPALWTENDTHFLADPHGVELLAKPSGTEIQDNKILFPKSRFPTLDAARAALGVLYPALAFADANPDGTFNLRNVELFSTGVWNGHKYSREDLDEMVRAYQEIGAQMRPYIKLGHDDAKKYQHDNNLPAIGWIGNMRREGEKLLCDLKHLPEPVYRSVERKGYRTKSPEIYWDLRWHNGQLYPRAIRAVALLGAQMPANPSLSDLYMYSEQDGVQGDLHVYEEEGVDTRLEDSLHLVAAAYGLLPSDVQTLLKYAREPEALANTVSGVLQGWNDLDMPEELKGKPLAEMFWRATQAVDRQVNGLRGIFQQQPPLDMQPPEATDPLGAPKTDEERRRFQRAFSGESTGGLPTLIEAFKGTLRQWRRPSGTVERPLSADYGEVMYTLAPDGDAWDVFVGPDEGFKEAFILTINTPRETEEKILLGFTDQYDAWACAYHHYGVYAAELRRVSLEDLKAALLRTKGLSLYSRVEDVRVSRQARERLQKYQRSM